MVWSLCRWVCRARSAPLAEPERTVGAESEPKLPRRARSSLRPRSGRREGGTHLNAPAPSLDPGRPGRRGGSTHPPPTTRGEGSQAGRTDLSQHCQETANSSVQPQEAGTALRAGKARCASGSWRCRWERATHTAHSVQPQEGAAALRSRAARSPVWLARREQASTCSPAAQLPQPQRAALCGPLAVAGCLGAPASVLEYPVAFTGTQELAAPDLSARQPPED